MTERVFGNNRLPSLPTIAAAIGLAILAVVLLVMASRERMPDFSAYKAGGPRKTAFFEYIYPRVVAANDEVQQQRERLISIAEDSTPGWLDRRWLTKTAQAYGLEIDKEDSQQVIGPLLKRIDTIPPSLAIAQAAKESGWGTSRFAREANNLFGEWCFEPGCGLVPAKRRPGKVHEVRAFDSPTASISSYLRNLNTHDAYRKLRAMRSKLRAEGKTISGNALAAGLIGYSQRGQAYVDEIRQIIRTNRLDDYPPNKAE